jgi:hypothetical protein
VVFIDTAYQGRTPITVTGLAPGEHQLMLDREGYMVEKRAFRIRDERESIKILRIGDDGSAEVLNTSFLYHDPVMNLDYFKAYSPHGLSKFSVSALGGPGNPFQMVYLAISRGVQSRSSGGGGGGGGGGDVAGPAASSTMIPTEVPTIAGTPIQALAPAGTEGKAGIPETPGAANPAAGSGPAEETTLPSGEDQGETLAGALTQGTSAIVILKNLSIVFMVVLVALVFYLRWNKREQ